MLLLAFLNTLTFINNCFVIIERIKQKRIEQQTINDDKDPFDELSKTVEADFGDLIEPPVAVEPDYYYEYDYIEVPDEKTAPVKNDTSPLLSPPDRKRPPKTDDSPSNQAAPDEKKKPFYFENFLLEAPPKKKPPQKPTNFGGQSDVLSRNKPPISIDFEGLVPAKNKPPTKNIEFEMESPNKSKPPKLDDASFILGLPFGK